MLHGHSTISVGISTLQVCAPIIVSHCLSSSVGTYGVENVRWLSDVCVAILHATRLGLVTVSLSGHHPCAWMSPILSVTAWDWFLGVSPRSDPLSLFSTPGEGKLFHLSRAMAVPHHS